MSVKIEGNLVLEGADDSSEDENVSSLHDNEVDDETSPATGVDALNSDEEELEVFANSSLDQNHYGRLL